MKKHTFYTEWAYVLGLALLAFGTAMTAWGDIGISMVVAPAFILHLKMSEIFPWFSFGMAEYILQAVLLLLIICILRRVKLSYLLSFCTAVIYGFMLDFATFCLSFLPEAALWQRILVYIVGDGLVCAGIAMMFRTYIPTEAYELLVKELSSKLKLEIHVMKTVYDCVSLVVAVVMALALFGELRGIGIGTVVCAFANGAIIKCFSLLYERLWVFQDKLPYRPKFEESEDSV